MFSFDESIRKSELTDSFYARLKSLSVGAVNVLTSRIPGDPFYTTVQAFVQMVSDAWGNLLSLLTVYDPNTTQVEDSLGFFERPRLLACECTMSFSIFRADATAALVVPLGATIQTPVDTLGRTRSFKLLTGFTIPAGVYVASALFQSNEKGLATTLISPQPMDAVSGLSGLLVASGVWAGVDNPFDGVAPSGWASWVVSHATSFTMSWAVQGRDDEDFEAWRARCFSRWDEQSTGSTASAYESWARSYTSPEGDSPVSMARVTENQVFASALCIAPAGQRVSFYDGQEYIMGVEVAIALRSGAIPSDDLLTSIGESMLPLKPHTDVLWLRKPTRVDLLANGVVVTFRGLASYMAQVRKVVESFFVLDDDLPGNMSSLGSTIHMSDVIHAVKAIDPVRIDDVKVVFTVAGKVVNGDIVLAPMDQLVLGTGVTIGTAVSIIPDPVV